MSVWLCIPSKRPPEEANPILGQWRERGYKTAIWRDAGDPLLESDLTIMAAYPGYSAAVNRLANLVVRSYDARWVVSGGDDTEPDPNHTAEQIAQECEDWFFESFAGMLKKDWPGAHHVKDASTWGIMQPTGDRFAEGSIDRICGSPWIGAEFIRLAYGGKGPFFDKYWHMFNDEEMQEVAKTAGILWQRRDLVHLHRHWSRTSENLDATANFLRPAPAFLNRANSRPHWDEMKAMFLERKAAGFPGALP